MRTPQGHQATVALGPVKIQGNRLTLGAEMTLELTLPDQDADLPKHLEAAIESGGQVLKRRLFQQAIEQADRQLVLARRQGKQRQGIVCRGTTPFIPYAAKSETSSNSWNLSVINVFSGSAWVVERPSRTSSMAARNSANVG